MVHCTATLSYGILSHFLFEKIICINGSIRGDTIAVVVPQLLLQELESPSSLINFYINFPGGKVTTGLAIFYAMTYVQSLVATQVPTKPHKSRGSRSSSISPLPDIPACLSSGSKVYGAQHLPDYRGSQKFWHYIQDYSPVHRGESLSLGVMPHMLDFMSIKYFYNFKIEIL